MGMQCTCVPDGMHACSCDQEHGLLGVYTYVLCAAVLYCMARAAAALCSEQSDLIEGWD